MRTYEKYKDSGISWIGKVPEDWDICKFKHTINIRNGKDYKDVQSDNHNDYPVYGSGGVFAYAKKYLYDGEALLLGRKGTIDKPIYIRKGKFWTVDTMFYGLATNGNVCKYLYYQALTFPFGRYATSTALPSMTQSDLGNNPICLPPIPEQEAIANYLDKKTAEIDKIIAEREKKIELLNELKSSIISRAVTKGINPHAKMKDSGIDWIGEIPEDWKVGRFKYSFKVRKGLTITKADLVDEGIPVISYGQVHSKDNPGTSLKESLLRYVPNKYLYSDKDSLVCKGDFIFADTSEDIEGCGNCVYVDRNMELFAGYHSIIAKSIHSDDCKFFSYLFLTDSWRKQIRTRVSRVKVFSITQDYLKNTTLIIPPYSEQKDIVDFLDKKTLEIDSTIATIKKECILYKEYKQSLISEVVTGKRKVID